VASRTSSGAALSAVCRRLAGYAHIANVELDEPLNAPAPGSGSEPPARRPPPASAATMDLFRSEDMKYVAITMTTEAAHATVRDIGVMNKLHVIDVRTIQAHNTQPTAQGTYTKQATTRAVVARIGWSSSELCFCSTFVSLLGIFLLWCFLYLNVCCCT
jgi:hypothetical protein